MSVESYTVGLT